MVTRISRDGPSATGKRGKLRPSIASYNVMKMRLSVIFFSSIAAVHRVHFSYIIINLLFCDFFSSCPSPSFLPNSPFFGALHEQQRWICSQILQPRRRPSVIKCCNFRRPFSIHPEIMETEKLQIPISLPQILLSAPPLVTLQSLRDVSMDEQRGDTFGNFTFWNIFNAIHHLSLITLNHRSPEQQQNQLRNFELQTALLHSLTRSIIFNPLSGVTYPQTHR